MVMMQFELSHGPVLTRWAQTTAIKIQKTLGHWFSP